MNSGHALMAMFLFAVAPVGWAAEGVQAGGSPVLIAQGTQQDLKGMEQAGQRNDTPTMTAAQQAQYQEQYKAAKAKWASLTPQEKSATIAAARTKKLSELSMMELVGQRNDMQRETAAQAAQDRAQADAAKAKWNALTSAQKKAVRQSAWQKKRSELDAMEAMGQRDDTYLVPW